MLDDFFIRALIAGIGIAAVAGPLGCFVVWRRMAYFGDTLSHAALLGVAMALLLQINITLAVFAISGLVSLLLLALQRRGDLSSDALLGLLSHSALAFGLVALAFVTWTRVDLMGLLFGDILSVSKTDIAVMLTGGILVLGCLAYIWHGLFAATVNNDMALAEGINTGRTNLAFMLLLAAVIAISMKLVGALLITALLIIPAASARHFAKSPEQMAVYAAVLGVVAVFAGLFSSLRWDTPSGPSIVVASALIFFLCFVGSGIVKSAINNED